MRRTAIWLAAALWAGGVVGAEPPAAVRALVIHVHQDIADRAFVAPLRRRLERLLAPPIHVLDTGFDLGPVARSGGKILGPDLLERLAANLDPAREQGVIHALLIAEDLRLPPARFNFAVSFGGATASHRLIVVSLSRLADDDPDVAAARVARMIVKNAARTAGYPDSGLCVLGFPDSLATLDATPEGFCEPDLSALVGAGLARR